MQKFIFQLIAVFFFAFTVSLTSCFDPVPAEDDATPYIVNFTFSKPSLTTATKNQFMPIDIRFDRNPAGYIHNVKVEIFDSKGGLVQKLIENNVHVFRTYTYSSTDAFKPLTAGEFTIRASTTAENGKQENKKEINITVQ